ncbi:MAG: Do family serine endopeptidase [bacterium]
MKKIIFFLKHNYFLYILMVALLIVSFNSRLSYCYKENKTLSSALINSKQSPSPTDNGQPEISRKTPIVLAVEKVSPAVVNISTERIIKENNPFYSFRGDFSEDVDFFSDFFDNFPQRKYKEQSLGSGVIVDTKGYILTNEHVILQASKIKVTLVDSREFEARLVGSDPNTDLAVLKIVPPKDLPAVQLGKSDDLMIGETVIAIGNPFGLSHTVTTGVISALKRSIKADDGKKVYDDFIQTDASINPGNSGGPLLNIKGELIGINTAIYQKAEGIGFAIPINKAKRIMTDLINYGTVHKPWLGMSIQEMTPQLANYFGLTKIEGVIVSHIMPSAPAQQGGIKEGDIIVEIEGIKIGSKEDYYNRLAGYAAGNVIPFVIIRDGKKIKVSIKSSEVPIEKADELAWSWLGLKTKNIDNQSILKYKLYTEKGVLITKIRKDSSAAKVGISEGDVIRQLGSEPVITYNDFCKNLLMMMDKYRVLVLVQRGQYGYYVTLQP